MLVLSRRPGESIRIDSNIRIVVVSATKGRVKLGIEAPDHVRIIRSELEVCGAYSDESDQLASLTPEGVAPLVPR